MVLKEFIIWATIKLKIVITDTGIGMEKEEIAGLFEKTFERGERAKKIYTTGRGIGLYISNQIIKANGGRLWAESEGRGKGSTFFIELPINWHSVAKNDNLNYQSLKQKLMEKVITIPKEIAKDDLIITGKESFERLNKENSELKKTIQAILAGEIALKKGKTRTFRQFLKSKYRDYAKNI